MCSTCVQRAAERSVEEKHQLIRLEEQMTRYHLNWLEIQHRIVSLEARLVVETNKPENEEDLVEMARLSRNLSAAKLDQGNVNLKKAEVVMEMKRIADAAKQAQTDPFAEFMQEAGLKPLSPDDPMYDALMGLVSALDELPGVTFGRPSRVNRGRGGFSPTARPGFGFPV